MNLSLAGTVLIVTGSTQGVGRAIALEAARNGAEAILLCGRDKARGEAVAAEVEALGRALISSQWISLTPVQATWSRTRRSKNSAASTRW